MKIPVLLKWVEEKNEWHLLTPTTKSFLYNLYNCDNMQRLFDTPSKEKDELFTFNVHRLIKGEFKMAPEEHHEISSCALGIKNSEQIKAMNDRQERDHNETNRRLAIVEKGITDIRDNLLGRPTWIQLIIITLLSGLCAGLSTWALTVLKLVIEVT